MEATQSFAGVTIGEERLSDLWTELMPMFARHFEELSGNLDIPLCPDQEKYNQIEASGGLKTYVMRDAEGHAIGYSLLFVSYNLHYSQHLMASQDIFWLAPEHRRGGLGARLVRYTDDALRAHGVVCVYQHVKCAHPALGVLLRRQGYKEVETIYSKRLDKG